MDKEVAEALARDHDELHADIKSKQIPSMQQGKRLSSISALLKSGLDGWSCLGIVIGGISVSNLVLTQMNLGTAKVFALIYETYRWLAHEVIIDFFSKLFGLAIPTILNDLIVIWFLCSAVSFRTMNAVRREWLTTEQQNATIGDIERMVFSLPNWIYILFTLFMNILLWPLAFIRFLYGEREFTFKIPFHKSLLKLHSVRPSGLHSVRYGEGRKANNYRSYWLLQIAYVLLVSFLLVVTNAGLAGIG